MSERVIAIRNYNADRVEKEIIKDRKIIVVGNDNNG